MDEYIPEDNQKPKGIPLEEGIPLQENLDKVIASDAKKEDSAGETALRALALAGQGASFGLVPKTTGHIFHR